MFMSGSVITPSGNIIPVNPVLRGCPKFKSVSKLKILYKSVTLTTSSNRAPKDFCEFAEIEKLFKSLLCPLPIQGGTTLIEFRSGRKNMFFSACHKKDNKKRFV